VQRGVRENIYQLLDYALDLVGFTRRPYLYLRRTIGKWRRKEKNSGSWLEIKIIIIIIISIIISYY